MLKLLDKEYHKYDPGHKAWKNGLFATGIVLFIFLLFQPFGFKDKDTGLKLVLYPCYSFFAFLFSQYNFYIVRRILKTRKIWTLRNEVFYFIINLFLITLVIHVFTYIITGDLPFNLYWYIKLMCQISGIYLIHVIIEIFYYNNKTTSINNILLNKQIEHSRQNLEKITKQNTEITSITLEKEVMEINRNKIIYIQSMGNYLMFLLQDQDGKINRITKRGQVQQADKDLSPFPEFFRCHRAYIVNLKYALNLKGNVKNARIILEGIPEKIPVSRSLYKNLKIHLDKLNLS